jgi:N-acyl-D-amino-acid deacylase
MHRSLLRARVHVLASCTLVLSGSACGRPSVSGGASPATPSTVITNVSLLDGSGSAARAAAVRIVGDRITEVSASGPLPQQSGETIVDGGGLTLAPGFIDTHSHADRSLATGSDALGALNQGITTVVVGQDGDSPYPLGEFFSTIERVHPPINVASYVGHGTIREHVMGEDYKRHATAAELDKMKQLLAGEMRAGALGLASGLEYDPGIYSAKEEMIELAKVAAASQGRYISHIRSEDRAEWDAIYEIINIGREAHLPVQISHTKLAMKSLWGQGDSLIAVLNRARASGVNITADIYPYRYWQSGLSVLFPERNYDDRKAAQFALDEVSPPDEITLTHYGPHPEYAGKTVAEIATMRGSDPVSTLMTLVKDADEARKAGKPSGETIIAASMDERDIERIMAWPFANICTDGELNGRHPRGYGSFTRVLGHYVRERSVVTLPEAIRKMTSLAADNVGIRNRGRVVPSAYADLVLFDPATVADRATPAEPHAVSVGIAKVWVNGSVAYENGKVTSARAGHVVRRP